ncbi:MAG: hypothetical protein HY846_08885 [Nitrosomonadales bacterium]|nr:hypothetical protein [Nitrosomonadales bacterium]
MTKRSNWDEVARKQRAQRHGTSYAYDELPPAGSWADQQRILARKKKSKKKAPASGLKNKGVILRQPGNHPLSKCPLCGTLAGKMEHHKCKTPKNAKTTAQRKLKAAVRIVNLSKAVVGLDQIVEDKKSGEKLIKLDQRGRVLKKPIPVLVKKPA